MPGLPISGCTPPWNPVDIIDGVMLAPALNMGGKPGRAMGFRNVHNKHNSFATELQMLTWHSWHWWAQHVGLALNGCRRIPIPAAACERVPVTRRQHKLMRNKQLCGL
jgi:hypothetical protein